MDAIQQIEAAVYHDQHWLTITPQRHSDGSVSLVLDIHGHFGAVAASDAPEAIAEAIAGLFDAMGQHVTDAAQAALSDSEASPTEGGVLLAPCSGGILSG